MANTTVNLGMLPQNRGEYSSSATYYKDNIVQYNGSSYICTAAMDLEHPSGITGVAPYDSDPATPNTGWAVFSNDSSGVGEGVYNVSVDHTTDNQPKVYANLSAALNDIPAAKQKGGMSIKFIQGTVQNNDHKYVSYRLTKDEWSIDIEDWAIADEGVYIENPEFVYVKKDAKGKILWAIKIDGGIYYGAGVPQQVIDYVNEQIEHIKQGTAGTNLDGINKIIAFLYDFSTTDTLKKLLDNKVDAESGKSLIQSDVADNVQFVEGGNEFLNVELDAQKRILGGRRYSGKRFENAPTEYNAPVEYNEAAIVETIDNPEFYEVKKDCQGRIIEAMKRDGTKEINVPICTPAYKTYYINNPEWMSITLDRQGRIIEGVKIDGTKVIYADENDLNNRVTTLEGKTETLENEVDSLMTTNKLMKVVVYALEGSRNSLLFYIRTKYNENKDIIITHYVNLNGLITFDRAFVGNKDLSDSVLMTSTYLVSDHQDSTAPIFQVKQYWHLFAQHGYPIPYVANTVNMTYADVGARWKDQLDREYTIGKVTETDIYLLPVIYQDANGHYVRDWKNTANSQPITTLYHESGGVVTSDIAVASTRMIQLRPIMKHNNREWIADGSKITEAGTYYCNEFKVSESQIGYDPATISDWFGGIDGNPVLEGAQEMALFTWSYIYCGAQCCMNTTINIKREVECDSYGAIQQQFFLDKGNYKAMFLIPKAAAQNGIELDKPFNSPSLNSQGYTIYRTSNYLKDEDDPIDRQIGFLFNESENTYLVGMAAGLSLISGDTVKAKRNANCLVGTGSHFRLGSISPANNNKFYVAAINTSQFENNQYYLPNTYFKEINCYVSYFDPAENVGQVYWYKDGNGYVIYCHCQSNLQNQEINVPAFMEGLKLSVVEKTADTVLLTDTIQNGKFFVNYNTNDANYIVVKTI